MVVEDSKAGIIAAKAGGMKSLGVGPLCHELGADFEAQGLVSVKNWEDILAELDIPLRRGSNV